MSQEPKSKIENYAKSLLSLAGALLDEYLARPDSSAGRLAAGKLSELMHELAEAAACYEETICNDPACWEAKARLALVQLKLGLNENGLKTAMELAEAAPEFIFYPLTGQPPKISSLTVLGDALLFNAFQSEALSAYARAVSLLPEEDSYAAGRYAQLLVAAGRTAEAVPLLDHIKNVGRFAPLAASLRLAQNDPALLPAVLDIRTTRTFALRDAV